MIMTADPIRGSCPIPLDRYPTVTLAHGVGGKLSRHLVEKLLLAAYSSPELAKLQDGAILTVEEGRIAFTTDSFVVTPPFFPGGDIGSLAVHGTVNDLAMCGARPVGISVGFILEEGFPMEALWRIALSIRNAADAAGVRVVTGDTKVVDRGKGDGIFVNTSAVGRIPDGTELGAHRIRPGDRILVSGSVAHHGIAILALREGLEFEARVETDSAPLNGLVGELLEALGSGVRALRDPTRGGVASATNEMAASAGMGMRLSEAQVPVDDEVRGACDVLGLDPLYVANAGTMLLWVAPEAEARALEVLRSHPLGRRAATVGEVVPEHPGQVFQRSRTGAMRVVEMLSGEGLPRIC